MDNPTASTGLLTTITEIVKYIPKVYTQAPSTNNNHLVIRYAFTSVPADSLLFVAPTKSMIDPPTGGFNTLRLLLPQVSEEGVISYSNADVRDFKIIQEQNDGITTKAGENSILANRLAIFRFTARSHDKAILLNSPLHHDIVLRSLLVTNDVTFRQPPVHLPDKETGVNWPLVTEEEYNKLLQRVEALEERFIFGQEDPEEALAGKPDGTVYIKVEDY